MKTRNWLLFLILFLCDLSLVMISLIISALYSVSPYVIHTHRVALIHLNLPYIYLLLCVAWYFSSKSMGFYDDPIAKPLSLEVVYISKNIAIQIVFLVLILFLIKEPILTRTFVLVYSFLLFVFLSTEKLFIRILLTSFKHKFYRRGNIIIIGANELASYVSKKLENHPLGYHIIGFIEDESEVPFEGVVLGKISELETVISNQAVDMVIVALPKNKMYLLESVVPVCQNHSIEVKIIPELVSYHLKRQNYIFLGDIPVVSVDINKLSDMHWRFSKRLFDIVFTFILSVFVIWWLLPLIIVFQKTFNPGPIFYKAERWGKGGKSFVMYKFRTMKTLDNDQTHDRKDPITERNDTRATTFGRLLRRTSLDEMPQFLNVLKGEMSIIGPRPFDTGEAIQMKQVLNNYMVRHYIKPGITGWAQINGFRGGTSDLALMQKRIDLDNWYINNWTMSLDFQIVIMTAFKFVTGDVNAF
jgi:putative colanic acid biosysnthesis UDP-glucose lipid carrier transferase